MKTVLAAATWILLAGAPACTAGDRTPIRVDRLLRLANHLDTKVPPARFDIGNWGSTSNPDDPDYVACAAGHATKLFAQDGFRYSAPSGPGNVVYRGKAGVDAAEDFFGLAHDDAVRLFTPYGLAGKDPHKAARNIRGVVAARCPILIAGP